MRDYLRSSSSINIFQWLFQKQFKLLKLEIQLETPNLAYKLLSKLVTWNLDLCAENQNVLRSSRLLWTITRHLTGVYTDACSRKHTQHLVCGILSQTETQRLGQWFYPAWLGGASCNSNWASSVHQKILFECFPKTSYRHCKCGKKTSKSPASGSFCAVWEETKTPNKYFKIPANMLRK